MIIESGAPSFPALNACSEIVTTPAAGCRRACVHNTRIEGAGRFLSFRLHVLFLVFRPEQTAVAVVSRRVLKKVFCFEHTLSAKGSRAHSRAQDPFPACAVCGGVIPICKAWTLWPFGTNVSKQTSRLQQQRAETHSGMSANFTMARQVRDGLSFWREGAF